MRLPLSLYLIPTCQIVLGQSPAQPSRVYDKAHRVYIPMGLEDAFLELDRLLPESERQALKTGRRKPIEYHHGLGMWMRNSWGLWAGSRLQDELVRRGFRHPDDMSDAILEAYANRLQGKPLGIEAKAAESDEYWKKAAQQSPEPPQKEELPHPKWPSLVASGMAGLTLEPSKPKTLKLPQRKGGGVDVLDASPAQGGVWIRAQVRDLNAIAPEPKEQLLWFDPISQSAHPIEVEGIPNPRTCMLVGGRAYALIQSGKNPRLMEITRNEARPIPLPPGQGDLRLGSDGQNLLAFRWEPPPRQGKAGDSLERPLQLQRWEGGAWKHADTLTINTFMDDFPTPIGRSGAHLLLQEEGGWLGQWDTCKRGHESMEPILAPFQTQDDRPPLPIGSPAGMKLNAEGVLWYTPSSAEGGWIFQRMKDGTLKVLIANGEISFDVAKALAHEKDKPQGLKLTTGGIHAEGERLWSLGKRDLIRIENGTLIRELHFENTEQTLQMPNGRDKLAWHWEPSQLLPLPDSAWLAAAHWGGLYRLSRSAQGSWAISSLDDPLGTPLRIPIKR